jgi:arylsulfatase A-like enzyme
MGDSMADVDHNVGLVMNALGRLKLDENTLVFWCTDNGTRCGVRGADRPDRGEEIDVKDFYPWVVSVMDDIVADARGGNAAGRRAERTGVGARRAVSPA